MPDRFSGLYLNAGFYVTLCINAEVIVVPAAPTRHSGSACENLKRLETVYFSSSVDFGWNVIFSEFRAGQAGDDRPPSIAASVTWRENFACCPQGKTMKKIESSVAGSCLPVHAQIRETLRQGIASGNYLPNAKLPSEKELMIHFQVSRISVRQALDELETEGLIYRVAGKGSFVSKPRPVLDLARLQGFGQAMSELGFETVNQVVGLATVVAPDDIAERLGLEIGAAITEIRRIRHVNHDPVSLDITYLPVDPGARMKAEELSARDISQILEQDHGVAPGHADLHIGTLAADVSASQALKIAKGAPVLYLERLIWTRDGAPLRIDRIYCRGDSFSYRLRIERA